MFHQLVGKASWLAGASVTGNWPGFVLFCLRFVFVQSRLLGAVIKGSIVWTSDWSYAQQLIWQSREVLCNSVRRL